MPRFTGGALFLYDDAHMNHHSVDTIVAQSTARGVAAIAVIRVSGPLAVVSVDAIFSGITSLQASSPRNVLHGYILDNGQVVDQVLLWKFLHPHSYTGEDLVEISCHGSVFVTDIIIRLIVAQGCRMAEPGEFSRRAFLNGKIDLVQAEAIADLIQSQTAKSLTQALDQLQGRLSQRLQQLRQKMLQQCSLLEIELDFSEEEIFVDRSLLTSELQSMVEEITTMIDSFAYGRILREGAHIAIVGKPNVGKSSLLNALLKIDRAIVSDIPGTTRDSLEESLNIDGFLFKISDTAGIRRPHDPVEQLGVQRSQQIIEKADLLLMVIDGSAPLTEEDLHLLQDTRHSKKARLIVLNKQDRGVHPETLAFPYDDQVVPVSCVDGGGLIELEAQLKKLVANDRSAQQEVIIDKIRHWQILSAARTDIMHALASLRTKHSPEFVAVDLKSALHRIGEMTGEVTDQEILNTIFSQYCIGK
jgi:tRNA modification GTPase